MKHLRNIPQYIKALKAEIDYLTDEFEKADNDAIPNLDKKIYKMSQLLIQLEKFKVTLDDINLLEEELQLL
jgi:lipid II:glycine glycyltransferase (peptidoglycan interpeptide bridge formation enzyme)